MSASNNFIPVNIAILTVSDTRTAADDTSGDALAERASAAGHKVQQRAIVKDDRYQIRSMVSQWIAANEVEAIILTGGTGFAGRDGTPEAVEVLYDKKVDGFGELFRQVSYEEIGSSTIQSRATAGLANNTVIFCVPGSTNACKTAWDNIISEQLDSTHRPCNFVGQIKSKS